MYEAMHDALEKLLHFEWERLIINLTLSSIPQNTKGVRKVSNAEYHEIISGLAESAFDDQCTGANPRYPLISDLRRILADAYDAPIAPLKSLEFFSHI